MHRDKAVVFGIFVLAVAAALGFRVIRGGGAEPAYTEPVSQTKPTGIGEFRGACLQLHSGAADHPYEQYIDEIARAGANTLCMTVAAYQENCSSTSIFVDLRKTPSDEKIKSLIAYAHAQGLAVVLMPIVLLENPREGEWRGKINPSSWPDWWEDYENYIMHYAWLSDAAGAEVFMVGSELVSTESDTEKWQELIARVRKAFHGRLSYSSNWDHYSQVTFWDDLDIVGMTTYHDLSVGDNPTVEAIMGKWEPIKKTILDWQATVNRPIMFTEVGWPNQITCAQYPWDYYRSTDKPDPVGQARCFEAFFRVWEGEPSVAGYLIWEWRSYPGQVTDPQKDTSYVPCDKPAMDVISRHFHAPKARDTHSAVLPTSQPTAGG
ncbi:MAG: hypothetical protein WC869_09090 [Phycisphaerae bacterium]|jgi:hypothetical protein